uniref:Uncharacterized protein n=1 Tax=Angiostrongylus cantonensis TaxID=6313 RepID=A0A0K0DAZ8_ANGCA
MGYPQRIEAARVRRRSGDDASKAESERSLRKSEMTDRASFLMTDADCQEKLTPFILCRHLILMSKTQFGSSAVGHKAMFYLQRRSASQRADWAIRSLTFGSDGWQLSNFDRRRDEGVEGTGSTLPSALSAVHALFPTIGSTPVQYCHAASQ